MKLVSLGDVVTVKGGGTPRKTVGSYFDGGIPWVTPKDMKRPIIDSTEITLSDDGVSNSPAKLVPSGAVLVVVRSGVLKHTLPVAQAAVPVTINQDMKALIPDEAINSTYLARLLKAREPVILGWVRATTADNFPIQKLLELPIPLPTLEDQRRIAAILDQVDALRAKRGQVLDHLDALTQSIFHEMFGSTRDRTWRTVPLQSVIPVIENGTSRNCEARPAADDEWGILKLGAVTTGSFRARENKAYLSDVTDMAASEVKPGDVLMTRKNTRDLVGAVAVVGDVRPRLLLPDLIFRLYLDRTRLNPQYFHALMMNPIKRQEVQALAGGSAGSMPNISKARLNKLPLELPPIALQERFAKRVRRTSFHHESVERSTIVLGELFDSLQSRAFRGQL